MAINGAIDWGFQPVAVNNSNLAGSFFGGDIYNSIKSVNEPWRFQIVWQKSGLNEGIEPSAANDTAGTGDVVYIKFTIRELRGDGSWENLAEITKTRDIANKKYDTGQPAPNHRFTIDISQIVADQLSYSLCPIGKGTWQSSVYGGMNGGAVMQDNVLSNTSGVAGQPVSNYNVSRNQTYTMISVKATAFMITNDGKIVDGGQTTTSNSLTGVNSVNQFAEDSLYYSGNTVAADDRYWQFSMSNSSTALNYQAYKFFSRCENFSRDSSIPFKKPIRVDEEAEFLNFYILRTPSNDIGGAGNDKVRAIGMYVETFTAGGAAENQFYVRDFEDNLVVFTGSGADPANTYFEDYQRVMFTQNISPDYINSYASLKAYNPSANGTVATHWSPYGTSTPITTSTVYYRVSLTRFSFDVPAVANARRTSEYRYYSIDREDAKIPYGFVRFHWLNDLGATDSYTAKRNIVDGYSIDKGIIERNSADRTYYQAANSRTGTSGSWTSTALSDSAYHSDTMRGGDIYKGGREVLNVNAERNLSVYTEPLNSTESKWLAKMMLSPNVWIEMDTQATDMGNENNPYLRPSTKEYIPVIITNSDVETVNQEQGLVSFNIEYTLSHKVITQRN